MPSVRLKIAVAGTGGGVFICSRPGQSSTLRWLARSYSCHALLARGAPANGLPSVITLRTWSGARRAISRAKTPPRLQPMRLTLRPESRNKVASRSCIFASAPGRGPWLRPSSQPFAS